MNIALTNFTPRELRALERATAKLRAQQPQDDEPLYPMPEPTTLPGCTWVSSRGRYHIYTRVDGMKLYCGSLRRWDEKLAARMQEETEHRYFNRPKAPKGSSSQD